jgi:hypothetical protein
MSATCSNRVIYILIQQSVPQATIYWNSYQYHSPQGTDLPHSMLKQQSVSEDTRDWSTLQYAETEISVPGYKELIYPTVCWDSSKCPRIQGTDLLYSMLRQQSVSRDWSTLQYVETTISVTGYKELIYPTVCWDSNRCQRTDLPYSMLRQQSVSQAIRDWSTLQYAEIAISVKGLIYPTVCWDSNQCQRTDLPYSMLRQKSVSKATREKN